MQATDFDSLLNQHAAVFPDKLALQDEDRAITWRQLSDEVQRLALLMQEHGAHKGQRLGLWMPNCTEWLVTFLACARLGITVVSINTRFREHEVGQLLKRGNCTWLALWPDFKGLPFAQILSRMEPECMTSLRRVICVGDNASLAALPTTVHNRIETMDYLHPPIHPEATVRAAGTAEDGALVYTTSGTTSAPKLVLHRQAGLVQHGRIAAQAYGIRQDSVVLLAAPLCGAFGFSTLLSALAVGASLVSLPVFDAHTTVRQIQQLKVTHSFANNELIDMLLEACAGQEQPFPSLEYLGYASFAPSMDDLPERALAAGIPIAGLYGSSELQALVAGHALNSEWQIRRSAGGTIASPEGRVRAMHIETGDALGHGEIGMIEIKSPSLMSEYLDNPDATREAVSADGFFRTGDLGYTVTERTFVFQGRDGEHLRLGGFLVNPMEIEQFIEALPGIRAVQVVGAQESGKTVPVAFVIPESASPSDETAIIAACTATMAKFKVPRRVAFVESFPVVQSANSNKIQKHVLRQMAQALMTG